MSSYAYCVSEDVSESVLAAVKGITGAELRLLHVEGLRVVSSEFSGTTVSVTRENVLTHERVVRRVLEYSTPLPFRFGTVTSETRLLDYVRSHRAALVSQLERVRGCVEMSVKVIEEPARSEDSAQQTGLEPTNMSGEEKESGIGTAFLEAKRGELLYPQASVGRTAEISIWLNERLGSTVQDAIVTAGPSPNLVLVAAFLVDRTRLDEYRLRLHQAVAERPELHFLTSGVWPPYSFTDVTP